MMIANTADDEVRPGSMGRPVCGIEAGLLSTTDAGEIILDEAGHVTEIDDPDRIGMIGLPRTLAIDVPRVPQQRGAVPQVLR